MKRYYLSPVVGTGSIDDPFRAAVADYGQQSVAAIIPTGLDGRPVFPWALTIVGRLNHGPLLSDAALGPLPDFPKDVRLSAMSAVAKTQLENGLSLFRLPTTLIGEASRAWRDVLRDIGRQLEPAFHEDALDCADQ